MVGAIAAGVNGAVQAEIDRTIAALAKARFDLDPLLPLAVSQACSVAESAKKRHGKIIEVALIQGLIALSRYQVWAPKRFRIPEPVDHLASLQAGGGRTEGVAFNYSGQGRDVQIDMLVYDPVLRALRAYEIKRGHGLHDAGKVRSMLRDLRCIQAVLKSFGEINGMMVDCSEAHILFWYGRRSIPAPWSIVGTEADRHFSCAVSAFVEAATVNFAARVLALISHEPDPYPTQKVLELRGKEYA